MRRFALDCLVNRILSSDVLHADETAIRLHNLNDAVVSSESVRNCKHRLTTFLRRYLPKFRRVEQLDVPCSTTVRDLERRRPRRRQAGRGRKREVPFQRADEWAAKRPESRWERIAVRAAEKGPLLVDAMTVRVRAKQDCRIGPEERLVVVRPVGEARVDYALTNAGSDVPLAELVRVQRERHRTEEVFEAGNGEAGLDHNIAEFPAFVH